MVPRISSLKKDVIEGKNPVFGEGRMYRRVPRVGLFGTAALNGRYTSSKAKYLWETDSKQVLRRKDEKNFEKRVKRLEIVEKKSGRREMISRVSMWCK